MTEPDPRKAIVERREEIAAEPRPQRLSEVDLSQQVAGVREMDDLFRVYRGEWIHVFSAAAGPTHDTQDEAALRDIATGLFDRYYAGRVRDDEVRYVTKGELQMLVVQLWLRLPNLKGEFKTRELAEEHVAALGWEDAVIVGRNSRDDHDLRNYGRKKLAS